MDPTRQPPVQPTQPEIPPAPPEAPQQLPALPEQPQAVVTPTVSPPTGAVVSSQQSDRKPTGPLKNKPLVIISVAGALLLIILLVVALSASPKPKKGANATGTNTAQSQEAQPATSTGLQQTSDSISQDISNLSDDHDLPANKFDDKSLGL